MRALRLFPSCSLSPGFKDIFSYNFCVLLYNILSHGKYKNVRGIIYTHAYKHTHTCDIIIIIMCAITIINTIYIGTHAHCLLINTIRQEFKGH